MKKETFTDKMMKRFYGITGPLDEYKRREVDRIGSICFILLFWVLLIGNALALLLADKYPEVIAFAYPIILTLLLLTTSTFALVKVHSLHLADIDKEELNQKEQAQMKFAGLKAGILFGGILWLYDAFSQNVPLFDSLFTVKAALSFFIRATLFGLACQLYISFKARRGQSE
ncbi:DUF3278 domain-containing protein [Streptococcus respiraculi]|uniref:DUF3278 domain-containing protein n=1 Tax=Streptococcus respiraculi TaxID=2021971 RepID=UPI000E746798|nr:DUF3278 domain-containing protein [Streptococcus respiraculi]